jgi:RNA polymerase sigma-70 factor, ECF subfamily
MLHAPLIALLTVASAPFAKAPDPDLVARIAKGDVGALHALYRRCASRAMAVAIRILKDRMEAEDIVQETFLEIWKRALEYDARRGGASAWIATIARSRAIDRLRSRGSASRAAVASTPAAGEHAVSVPLELAEDRQERERISAALAALPPEQRGAIELAYFEGLTQREISERTGDPLGTIKTRVRLALGKLAAILGGEGTPP